LALFAANEHLNAKELSRYTPRYLEDVTQLTVQPHTITLAHCIFVPRSKAQTSRLFSINSHIQQV